MTLNFGHCRLPREETATTTATTTIKRSTASGVIARAMTNRRQRNFSKEKQPDLIRKDLGEI